MANEVQARRSRAFCRNWQRLHRTDQKLSELAERYGVTLEDGPDDLSLGEQVKLDQRRAKQVDEVRRRLRQGGEANPACWQELVDWLYVGDPWLIWFIKGRKLCRKVTEAEQLEDLVKDVLAKLFLVILRNSGRWYRLGDHTLDWLGYVIGQIEWISFRLAKAVLEKNRRERPLGAAEEVGSDPFAELAGYEVGPEKMAEWQEIIQSLPKEQGDVLIRLLKGTAIEQIAEQLEITVQQADERLRRAKRTLLEKLKTERADD